MSALLALPALLALLGLVWLLFRPRWMGFEGLTLWNWTQTLAVPTILVTVAVFVTDAQFHIQRRSAAEAALQTFVDRMSVVAQRVGAGPPGPTDAAVIRAQTNAVLHLLDGEQSGRALRILAELGLLSEVGALLEARDLSGADLKALPLAGADLEGTNLAGAELEEADLRRADLEAADLRRADLKDADLRGADLAGARLDRALLDHADLRDTDLSAVTGLGADQLRAACLSDGTALPAGVALDPAAATGCTGRAEAPDDGAPDDDGADDDDAAEDDD